MADISGLGSGTSALQQQLLNRLELGFERSTQSPSAPQDSGDNKSFVEALQDAIGSVNEAQVTADKMSQDFAAGKGENLHNLMIAMEKAEIQLRTLVQVRNKVVESYQEVMRMQV